MQEENINAKELQERTDRVSIKDPEHLKRWVDVARPFTVFVTKDMVDALRWPEGHQAMQSIVSAYNGYRLRIPTGDFEIQTDPVEKKKVEVPIMKDQRLTAEEMDRCIRWMVGELTDLRPDWSLGDAPL